MYLYVACVLVRIFLTHIFAKSRHIYGEFDGFSTMKPRYSSQVPEVKAARWVSAPLVVSFIALFVLLVAVVMLSQSTGTSVSVLADSLRHQSFDPGVFLVRGGEALSGTWVQLIQSAGSGVRL